MPETKLPSVRDHADALIGEMVKDGRIAPDSDAAKVAAGIPTFSKGTATLDPNTGQPVAPAQQATTPEFTEGGVAVPEGTSSAEPIGAPPVAPREAEQAQPAAPASVQAGSAGVAAAEQAAQQMADAFADYEEIEVDDADLGMKYPIRVPKQYATSAKRGYPRRATFDRTMQRYNAADPALRQIIEDGRIGPILPLLQRALDDPEYGDYVFKGYQRRTQGLPLIEQAVREAATPAPELNLDDNDPFLAERIRPLVEQYQALSQTVQQMQAAQQQTVQQQAAQQRLNEERGEQMRQAHLDLARSYPEEYTGDLQRDHERWQRVIQFAKDGGYVERYGYHSGLIFAAQWIRELDQQRLAATASPAATALQQAEQKHLTLAQQQSAAAARTVGGGAPANAPPPAPLPKPGTRNPDGTMKPPGQFLLEQQAYLAQDGVPA